MAQSKFWCFTHHNPSPDAHVAHYALGTKGGFQYELCPTTGRAHMQGWNSFDSNRRLAGMKKLCATTTLAGVAGSFGASDGSARFYFPRGVAVDATGNVYVADSDNHIIRKLALVTTFPACDSTWRHAALTYTATPSSLISVFVDGALRSTSPASVSIPTPASSTLRVGWGGELSVNSGSLFAGSLAELRIYSRALTVTEVVALSQPPLSAVSNAVVRVVSSLRLTKNLKRLLSC